MPVIWNPQSELLREPNLLVPGKKPIGPVKIDWGHSLAKGLIGCWLFNTSSVFFKDLTGNNDGVAVGTGSGVGIDHDVNGVSARIIDDNTADRINLGSITSDNPLSIQGGVISIHASLVHTASSNNSYPRIIDKSTSGSGANGWSFYTETNTRLVLAVNGTNIRPTGYSPTGEFGSVGVSAITGSQRFFQDGENFVTSTTSFTVSTSTSNAALLNWNHSTDRQYESPVYCIYVWNRYLSAGEHVELDADPYQFLIPA